MAILAVYSINYLRLSGAHQQAQSAIDAAALAAGVDMGKVVIDETDGCHFGVVALVDDTPRQKDNRPVLGINTLMATIRLDAIIANQLQNSTLLVLATNDLENLQADSLLLRNKIILACQNGTFTDKNGNVVNMLSDANASYDQNANGVSSGARVGSLTLTPGQFVSAQGTTNIPVASPASLAQVTPQTTAAIGSTTFYLPLVDQPLSIATSGGGSGTLHFQFIPTPDNMSIVDSSSATFTPTTAASPGFFPPFVIRVDGYQQFTEIGQTTAIASKSKKTTTTTTGKSLQVQNQTQLHVASAAQIGSPRHTFASGLLQLAFPQTAPPQGQGPNCSSLQTLMNTSQIQLTETPQPLSPTNSQNPSASTLGSTSPYLIWNSQSTGHWTSASGGAVPADPGASLIKSSYRGRSSDDPSVVLSFLVYDWLHAMYLRPNIQGVVSTLSQSMGLYGPSASSSSTSTSMLPQDNWLQGAYASSRKTRYPVTFGLTNVPADGNGDPRDLRNFANDPEGYRRQIANVFGYVAADATLPDQTLTVSINEKGQVVTTNGQPATNLVDFFNAITSSNQIATQSFMAAQAALKQSVTSMKALEAQTGVSGKAIFNNPQFSGVITQVQRAAQAKMNAVYVIHATLALLNDRKTITSLGVTEVSSKDFQIVNGDFYPPTQAATVQQILGSGVVATGQAQAVSLQDWCAPPVKGKPQFELFVQTQAATTGMLPSDDGFLQPVMASSSVPQSNQFIINFNVVGDASLNIGTNPGAVNMSQPTLSSAKVNVINGQELYQNTASLITLSPGTQMDEKWNCMARDNGANYSGSTAFFANQNDPGYNGSGADSSLPPLIAEWSLRCPAPNICVQPNGQIGMLKGTSEPLTAAQAASLGVTANINQISLQTDSAGNVSFYLQGQPIHFLTQPVAGVTWTNAINESDAVWTAVGGFGSQTGGFWNYDPTAAVESALKAGTAYNEETISKYGTATAAAYQWDVYSTGVFLVNTPSGCMTLYSWSS
jgi:hypothetical protein